MGHYTAHAIRLRLRPDTPVEVLDVLRSMIAPYNCEKASDSTVIMSGFERDVFESVRSLMHGATSSFWHWDSRTLQQHENGEWELLTYSSSKRVDADDLGPLMGALFPYLLLEDGEIIWREMYEMQVVEQVIYFDKVNNAFAKCQGHPYALPDEMWVDPLDCPNHGWNDDEPPAGEPLEPYNPPWNIALIHQETLERIKDRTRKNRREHQKHKIRRIK